MLKGMLHYIIIIMVYHIHKPCRKSLPLTSLLIMSYIILQGCLLMFLHRRKEEDLKHTHSKKRKKRVMTHSTATIEEQRYIISKKTLKKRERPDEVEAQDNHRNEYENSEKKSFTSSPKSEEEYNENEQEIGIEEDDFPSEGEEVKIVIKMPTIQPNSSSNEVQSNSEELSDPEKEILKEKRRTSN